LDARVLVVDDDRDTLEIMRVVLDAYGAQTAVAATAAEAFATLRTLRPEVLLSDISLPGEDGYDLLRRVRALSTEDGGDTPAVAISAHVYTSDRERAFDAGFQAFLAKPINPAALVECVRSMVERGRAKLERRRGPRRAAHSTLDANSERRTFERRQPFSPNQRPRDS
jgi:CheY-like chemotaxis protein